MSGPSAVAGQGGTRRILALAWPVFIGQLAVVGHSTIDTVIVARHARADLAALSVGSAAYVTVFVGLMGVVLALGPIVGQLFGAGRHADAGRQVHQAVWIALLLSALGGLVLLFPLPFMAMAQAPAEVEAKARSYMAMLALALPGALLMQVYRGFNNAIARPKAVMVLQIGGLVAKVPLSLLLVFGWPAIGLAPMGVLGCGAATVVVMWLLAAAAYLVLRQDRFYEPFVLRGRGLDRPDRLALAAQLRLGVPMGLGILVEVSGFAMMAVFIARLGVVPSAAHQIAANVAVLLFMLPLALASATTTLVAQRIGAADLPDARRLGWQGLRLGLALAGSVGVALWLGRSAVARLYTHDAAVIAATLPLLAWVALFHLADAAQALVSFVLRAWRVVTVPMLISAGSLWGIGQGGGHVLAFDIGGLGARGYWIAATTGMFVAALALIWWLRRLLQRTATTPTPPAAA